MKQELVTLEVVESRHTNLYVNLGVPYINAEDFYRNKIVVLKHKDFEILLYGFTLVSVSQPSNMNPNTNSAFCFLHNLPSMEYLRYEL